MPDTKFTGLPADTAPNSADLIVTIDDPSGTPTAKKVTLTNAITKAHGLSDSTVVGVASGVLTSGVDVAVVDGGTGSSTAGGARTNLGLVIGTDVQAYDADLTTIAGLTATTDNVLQSVASAWASRTPAQVTATLPVFVPDTGSGGAKGLAPATAAGDATKFLKGDGTWASIPGGGDALVANPLSQFASTTSAQLAGVISDETGTNKLVFSDSPTLVTPALGTPTSGVLTNCTGTAAGLTAGTVTTNANLTGPITSVGNATAIASQTGTGSKIVVDTSPTLVTPALGVATATSINKVAITAPATGSTLTIADGKTLTASNTIALTGTDGVSLNVSNAKLERVQFSIDGGGSAISTGQKGTYPSCVYAGTITAWTITVDTGTCTAKFWKVAAGTAIPTISDNINTSGVSISSGTVIRSTTLSDFTTTTVTANDIFALNLTAVSGATKIFVCLEITRS